MQPHVISEEVKAIAAVVLACLGGAAVVVLLGVLARCIS
jgi:hypothetical protein